MLIQITLLHSVDDLIGDYPKPDPKLPGSCRALAVKNHHIMNRIEIKPTRSGIPPEFKTWGLVILTMLIIGLLSSMF